MNCKFGVLLSLCLFGVLSSARAQDATPDSSPVDDLLIAIVAASPDNRVQQLNDALLTMPGETEMLLRTAIEAGYPDPEVEVQCQLGVDSNQSVNVIEVMAEQGGDLDRLAERCLPSVAPKQMVRAVTALLLAASSGERNGLIELTYTVLLDEGIEPSTILVDSLISSGLVATEDQDCVGDCERLFAEDLVQQLTDDTFENATDTGQDDEPPLSRS